MFFIDPYQTNHSETKIHPRIDTLKKQYKTFEYQRVIVENEMEVEVTHIYYSKPLYKTVLILLSFMFNLITLISLTISCL